MSFQLLKNEIIDPGLCQGCGLCAGLCKNIEMVDLKPELVDMCIMEKNGLSCGRCYMGCPQVIQTENSGDRTPINIYALQTNDPKIKEKAVNGGFVTTLNQYLFDNEKISHLIQTRKSNMKPIAEIQRDSHDLQEYAGMAYGRSGVLEKLAEVIGEPHETIGVVGVPCEIRGAAKLEKDIGKDFFKIGLFCKSNIDAAPENEDPTQSPCHLGCPAGVDSSGYVHLIREGKFQEAVDLNREMNALPSLCGRICTHECEYNCTLIGTNHPIAIRELKKFITEWEMDQDILASRETHPKGKKVAIIGSGPAGLSAGYYLAKRGYRPTIFEKEDQAGGMVRFGVPKFRLPDKTLDYDIKYIQNAGVEIRLNTTIGPDLTFDDLKKQGFEAIFVAIGQYKPRSFHLPGEDLPNMHYAIEFLLERKYRHWENPEEFKGKVVGIMGAGPVAVDVAQTALRLGASKIIMTDVQTAEQMKMAREEIPEMERRFCEFHYETSTEKFTQTKDGRLNFNSYVIKAEKDENGRLSFNKVENSEFLIEADSIVIAVGQSVDYELLDKAGGNAIDKNRGKISIDELTFQTNVPYIFAGGDIISRGKNVAVAAIAHGREAAMSIDRFLKGKDLKSDRKFWSKMFFAGPLAAPLDVSKKPVVEITPDKLWMNFSEIEGVFDEEMAVKEAHRCLNCNNYCRHCLDFAAENADITAGNIGSEKDYTTVIAWTDRGKEVIDAMIKDNLVKSAKFTPDPILSAISDKKQRIFIPHSNTLRDLVYNYVKEHAPTTIPVMSKQFGISTVQVRYHALRLTQEKEIGMKINNGLPIFSMEIEEE